MPFTPYLNNAEIDTALQNAATNNPSLCTLITLPNTSHEGRTSYALKIAGGTATNRKGLLLLGGVHAREWGGSDILIAFMERIIDAYNINTGITFQGKSYTTAEIQQFVNTLDIFIFPNVNPDGKVYSQSGNNWRKNRRPESGSIGIDINRNYDFLWDSNVHFHPLASSPSIYSPSSETYHGPSAFSEAETLNIKHIIDTYTNISYFIDIHCYGQKIMYIWGDDEIQESTPEHNFANSSYDGQRGLSGDSYSEFMFETDHSRIVNIANRMHNALFAVRGKSYSVGQIFNMVGAASGSSACYMFSRHFVDSLNRKIFGYGIEFGTSFQPIPSEMSNIMDDIDSALTEFCLCVSEPDIFIRDNLNDTGKEPSEGTLSQCPDIITRRIQVTNPAAEFNDISIDPGSDKVEIGNDNYIYVRVHNNGGMQTNAYVSVYYAPLNTSCSPALWQFIDDIEITDIPANGFKASEAIIWPHVPDPGTGNHFCIIAICNNTLDPTPDFTMIDSASDFMKYVKNSNNISYRNIVFEDLLPDSWYKIPFVIQGFSKMREKYEIVIDEYNLPEDTRIELTFEPIRFLEYLFPKKLNYNVRSITERIKLIQPIKINNIDIRKLRYRKAYINIKLPRNIKSDSNFNLTIAQKLDKLVVGQFTLIINHKN